MNPGVVSVETPTSRHSKRELVVELVDWRSVFNHGELGRPASHRVFPESAVEELFTRMILVVARPLNASERLEPLVTHPAVHR